VKTKSAIESFLAQRKLAVVGVSRGTKQFANSAYRLLKMRGYTVYPVNPNTVQAEGDRCFPDVASLPEKVEGVIFFLPPEKTMKVLPEIVKAGIQHVWLQQQTESPQAIQFCLDHGIEVVYGECILMFVEPVNFPHRMHRWVKKVTGALPK
jgi:uncharacterized protein